MGSGDEGDEPQRDRPPVFALADVGWDDQTDKESLEGWNRIINVNLTGAFLGLKTMIPLFRLGKDSAVYTIEVQADGQ